MKTLFLIAGLSLLKTASFSQADNIEEQILKLEQERFQAMIEVDIETLEKILSDDLSYTHTSGWTQTKQELLHTLQSGQLDYQSAKTSEEQVRIYHNTAVITGNALMQVLSGNNQLTLSIHYIDVYVEKARGWQMVAWQSLRIND